MFNFFIYLDITKNYFEVSIFSSTINFKYILHLWEIYIFNIIFIYKIENIWFFLSIILYIIGISGFIFNTQNLLIILIKSEIMFLGVGLNFIGFSNCLYDPKGQLYTLFLLIIIAIESIIGLSLIYTSYRLNKFNSELIDYSLLSN